MAELSERERQVVQLAEKVMGWNRHTRLSASLFPNAVVYSPSRTEHGLTVWNDSVHINQLEGWDPFVSLADAWMLVEKLRERGLSFRLYGGKDRQYSLALYRPIMSRADHEADGDTAPEAICAACLSLLDSEEGK